MKHLFAIIITAVLLTACGKKAENKPEAAVSTQAAEINEVMGIAFVEPMNGIAQLAQSQAGTITQVFAQAGQHLDSGQVILSIDHRVESAQLGQTNARMGAQNEAIATAQASLALTEAQLSKARADHARNEALHKGNAITQQALDNSLAQVTDLDRQLRVQQAQLSQQRARSGELRAESIYVQQLIARTTLRAPSKGTLLSMDIRAGEYLDGRSPVAEFAPDGPVIALTEIDELFADKVKVGQKAYVRAQGSTQELSKGTVVLTSPYLRKKSLFSDNPANLEDRRVREVRVQLDSPEKVLIGARVECIIITQ